MSIEDKTVSFSFETNIREAGVELRRLQTLMYRSLSLLRRFGLPEDIDRSIAKIQQLIAVMNMLRLAAIALQAASGPIGWGLFAVGFVSSGFAAADMMMDLNSG